MKRQGLSGFLVLVTLCALALPARAGLDELADPPAMEGKTLKELVEGAENGGLEASGVLPEDPVYSAIHGMLQISPRESHTAGIDADGGLWCWGSNAQGQLGIGSKERVDGPVKVMDGVAQASTGSYYTLAVKTDGTLWAWGDSRSYRLGNGGGGDDDDGYNNVYQTFPVQILNEVRTARAGADTSAAIRTDGSLWMWGDNSRGQLGNGGAGDVLYTYEAYQSVPVKVLDGVADVSLGRGYTMALRTDGSLWMWGSDNLGLTDMERSDVPVKVMDDVKAISAGGYHAAAIKTNGTLWTWGANGDGCCGTGTTERVPTPVQVMEDVAAVSAGDRYTMALKTDGTVWTCGLDRRGRTGITTANHKISNSAGDAIYPSLTKMLDGVAQIVGGSASGFAFKADGTIWAWGDNEYGELGSREIYDLYDTWYFMGNTYKLYYQSKPVQVGSVGQPTAPTAYASPSVVAVDGRAVAFDAYALKDAAGNATNYVKLRDVASVLNGTAAQFNVEWDGSVRVVTGRPYAPNGSEMSTPFSGDRSYTHAQGSTLVDGNEVSLDAIVLTDDAGNGYTYYKLRDLGQALGFLVDWSADLGITLDTDKSGS